MVRKYDNTKRYSERDAILLQLELQYEILQELKAIKKIIKKGESIKRSPQNK